jgi:hypothetical protein
VLSSETIDYKMAYYLITSYFLACVLGFIITGFLFFHLWLIYRQYTTIEFCEKRSDQDLPDRRSPYDLGLYKNFQTVLGNNVLTWFLPFCKDCYSNININIESNTEGEGIIFEVRHELKHDN